MIEVDARERNAGSGSLRVGVVVPTFRRPADLRRCLGALALQRQPADEVIVVVRDIDDEARAVLSEFDAAALRLRTATVTVPGQIQALNAGLKTIASDIMAITDDDAAPHEDWLERIVAHFRARSDVAAVGGRDHVHQNGKLVRGEKRVVGRIPRIGNHVGNHHLGFGRPREVDMVKGVNGSYRVAAIRDIGFDERLRGTGAQVHWEISLGLALRRRGWKLLYDPQVAVDHFLAPRFDEDQRNAFNALAVRNMAFNEGLVRLERLTLFERILFFAWATAVGNRELPGFVQLVRFLPAQRGLAVRRFLATARGRSDAWRSVGRLAQS